MIKKEKASHRLAGTFLENNFGGSQNASGKDWRKLCGGLMYDPSKTEAVETEKRLLPELELYSPARARPKRSASLSV